MVAASALVVVVVVVAAAIVSAYCLFEWAWAKDMAGNDMAGKDMAGISSSGRCAEWQIATTTPTTHNIIRPSFNRYNIMNPGAVHHHSSSSSSSSHRQGLLHNAWCMPSGRRALESSYPLVPSTIVKKQHEETTSGNSIDDFINEQAFCWCSIEIHVDAIRVDVTPDIEIMPIP
jgi:hypothetical protein